MTVNAMSILAQVSPGDKTDVGYGTMAALLVFILASVWIGLLANRAMRSGSFLKGFFLGNRGLGAWALALTATVQSGGTFMGFPSLVYSHGWIVLLWICGYMVVPITGFGVLGKRVAQLSRRTGAITVPDLFRARFESPNLGLIASLLIMFYMAFMMVAQFKAGALIIKNALPRSESFSLSEDLPAFQINAASLAKLREAGAPEEVLGRLENLRGKAFDSEAAFKNGVVGALDREQATRWQTEIIGSARQFDWLYIGALVVFTLTVVSYTLMGGFLAAVWTDLFQSVMMLFGVLVLLILALSQAGGMEQATIDAVKNTGPGFVYGPGFDPSHAERQFLPLGLAFSFFWVWVYSGLGSPAGIVRIMSSKNTEVIRKSIYLLSGYNALIYIPLVIICICGRALIPDLQPGTTDEIIPRLALRTTSSLPGGSFIAGLILAAPFGAVMATVSSYLVVISSGLVRDIYQRYINPGAGTHDLRRLSYIVMILVGAIAIAANIKPVAYLQAIVVFSGTSAAATFCVPALMVAFWRRATSGGVAAAMLAGTMAMLALYVVGFYTADPKIGSVTSFRPYFLLRLDPLIWGLSASLLAGISVSYATAPPSPQIVSKLFDAQ
jgi:sodium/pantothenate symporter